ncbi:MAG: ACP S-malonyltransferase [Gammaproteobacteria bacterium]|nr:ACP S-malonyltransferase [Gammaproteobacteria bacterium]
MKIAYLFPGQGSQSPGMLAAFEKEAGVIRKTFDEASAIMGRDLWALAQQGSAEELNQTVVTQPLMLTAGIATWRVAQARGMPAPNYVAGHSLGEYSALVAAQAMAFADAVGLVEQRARLMQDAVAEGEGAMAAVLGLDDVSVQAVCAEAEIGEVVEAVNFNAPGQVVIAGHRQAVSRACELAKQAGAKRCIELPVSVPSHCRLMREASEQLSEHLAQIAISAPRIPVVHNVDVSVSSDAAGIRAALTAQLYRPVRWAQTIEWLRDQGIDRYVECGPGKVLAGLNRRIDRSLQCAALIDDGAIDNVLAELGANA